LVPTILDSVLASQVSPYLADAGQRNTQIKRLPSYRRNGPAERGCGCGSQSGRSFFGQHFQLGDVFRVPWFRKEAPDHGYLSGGRSSPFNQPWALITGSGSTAAWMKLHFGHSYVCATKPFSGREHLIQ
jgi:hypothetical protein